MNELASNAHTQAGRKRWRSTFVKRVLGVLVAAAVAVAIVIAWMPAPVPVELSEVTHGPMVVTVDEDGRTRVRDRYVVSAPLLANLARIELHPGDAVEPGTVLARLVPLEPPLLDARTKAQAESRVAGATAARAQSQASVRRARTALEFAQREATRQRDLVKTGAASTLAVERAELEERTLVEALGSAEFGTLVAAHELAMAQAALGRLGKVHGAEDEQMELTSPVKGRVLRVIHESEGAVQPGTPLVELGDPAALEIVSDVLTSDAVHVRPGASASIERWGGPPLRGHVRLVEPSAFTAVSALGVEEQRVNVVIDLDTPKAEWAALGDGYRVEVRIAVWEGQDVVSIPAGALFRSGRDWAAYRVADGHAQFVTIDTGRRNAERVEVTRGLTAGDRVIVYPSDRIEHGVRVEAR